VIGYYLEHEIQSIEKLYTSINPRDKLLRNVLDTNISKSIFSIAHQKLNCISFLE